MPGPRDGFFLLLRLHARDQSLALGSAQHPSFFQWALKVEHRILELKKNTLVSRVKGHRIKYSAGGCITGTHSPSAISPI